MGDLRKRGGSGGKWRLAAAAGASGGKAGRRPLAAVARWRAMPLGQRCHLPAVSAQPSTFASGCAILGGCVLRSSVPAAAACNCDAGQSAHGSSICSWARRAFRSTAACCGGARCALDAPRGRSPRCSPSCCPVSTHQACMQQSWHVRFAREQAGREQAGRRACKPLVPPPSPLVPAAKRSDRRRAPCLPQLPVLVPTLPNACCTQRLIQG